MSEPNMIIFRKAKHFPCNCVKYARYKVNELPFGLWTIRDKKKIINSYKPKKGRVAIMKVGLPWGHLGVVTKVEEDHISVKETNYKFCKKTKRHDTPENLKVIGYFNPHKFKYCR